MLVANSLIRRPSGQPRILKLPKDVDVIVIIISQHPFIDTRCSCCCWPGARAARPLAGLRGPGIACSEDRQTVCVIRQCAPAAQAICKMQLAARKCNRTSSRGALALGPLEEGGLIQHKGGLLHDHQE